MKNDDLPRTRAWPTGEREKIRARIAAHRAADEIVQGLGWDGARGGAIGCSLDRYDHAEYARVVLGDSPHGRMVAGVIEDIHEMLPYEVALDWPGRVADAIDAGADTTLLLHRWLHWLLAVELADFAEARPMAELMARSLAGDEPSSEEWDRGRQGRQGRMGCQGRQGRQDRRAAWAAWAARAAKAANDTWDAWGVWATRATCAAWGSKTDEAAWADWDARAASAHRMADALVEIMRSLPSGRAL